jgi:hydroxymethylglutaryl-CoA lyase
MPTRSIRPYPGFPVRVNLHEVGPRDGLQNEQKTIPVEIKAEFITRLVDAGIRTIEATSFVSPRWVPQLADAETLLPLLPVRDGVRYPVLVPNLAGLNRALACGARDIAIFASATESFSRRNLNCSIDESLVAFTPVVDRALREGLWVRGYLSMCFGDPWEGPGDPTRMAGVARRLVELGCDELSIGDTIGVATPGEVGDALTALALAGIGVDRIAVHFHDTYGQALANTMAALEAGVVTIDASAGGLGGCPFAESATGNLATEDLLWTLAGLGIDSGIDLQAVVAASAWMADHLGRPSPSRVVRALKHH